MISFQPLRDSLAKKHITLSRVCRELKIGEHTQMRIARDGNVSLEVLEKIAFRYNLSVGEMMKYIPES